MCCLQWTLLLVMHDGTGAQHGEVMKKKNSFVDNMANDLGITFDLVNGPFCNIFGVRMSL
jgi:hypothetical protein